MDTKKIYHPALLFINLLAIYSGLFYRLYELNAMSVFVSLILAISTLIIILFFQKHKPADENDLPPILNDFSPSKVKWLKLSYLSVAIISFSILFIHTSDNSLVTPWQVVPGYFFISYFLATALLMILSAHGKSSWLIYTHYILSFSVLSIIYRIGYGFDPFIHRATMELIDKTGSVDPKPLYYLGQYGLEVSIHKLSFIPIKLIDRLLVPLMAALALPTLLRKISPANHRLLSVLILMVPFSILTFTTPQHLAYLWLIITVAYGLKPDSEQDKVIMLSSAVASLITQPIAGVPAMIFVIMSLSKGNLRKYLRWPMIISSSLVLPALLYVSTGGGAIHFDISTLLNNFMPIWTAREDWLINFIYLYGFNLFWVIAIMGAIGLSVCRDRGCRDAFYLSLACLASYVLTLSLPFNSLIDYERTDYADRMLVVAAIFMLPSISKLLDALLQKLKSLPKTSIYIWFVFFVLIITASLYLSYPRTDNYFNSRSYGVGADEIEAVNWIDSNSTQPYVVLANQQVSVAALNEFGFDHYLRDNIFYYPIPTGGPLYRYFLDMVYKQPNQETMDSAMDLAGVNESYFVLNKYWWAFSKILDEAKLSAKSYHSINNGEIYIFKYEKSATTDVTRP